MIGYRTGKNGRITGKPGVLSHRLKCECDESGNISGEIESFPDNIGALTVVKI
jgi:hypothetical protein